ncbi:MAG: UDP-N-acetylmuramate--L-alanine ligase [Lachnospiraceae bacterium]|nr:UDP-N-acetylmuramate--L-alanine ligase [Lachnospiraceae bacterium]
MYQMNFEKPAHVYFIGIGGISMSGLAKILLDRNFKVSGSDWNHSAQTDALEALGAVIHYGEQKSENITKDIDVLVYTAAVHPDNPEFVRAKELEVPMLTRAEFLGELMELFKRSVAISGTHGKTTTTTMISEILMKGAADPTILNGGIIRSINSNTRIGHSDILVSEACEYTNSFHSFYPMYSVVMNIEEDHLDFFKDLEDIRKSFLRFMENTKKDGYVIANGEITALNKLTENLDRKVITFGLKPSFDYHASNITTNEMGHEEYDLYKDDTLLGHIVLALPGIYNVYNSLAAAATTLTMGIPFEIVADGLLSCVGSKRRFEIKGDWNGVTILDDYAHHPTEIESALEAARTLKKNRIICVYQPHTYTRTKALFPQFVDALSHADIVVLPEIYAARETDNLNISSRDIADALNLRGIESYYYKTFEEVQNFLRKKCINGDLLITMGAGNVVDIGEALLKE